MGEARKSKVMTSPQTFRQANLVISAALILAAALYLCSVGDPRDSRYAAFGQGGPPLVCPPGGQLKLDLGQAAQGAVRLRLRLSCGAAGGCGSLRVVGAGGPKHLPLRGAGPRQTEFHLGRAALAAGPVLQNLSSQPVHITQYRVQESLASNSAFPRLAVLLAPRATGGLRQTASWLVMLGGMAMLVAAVILSARRRQRRYLNGASLTWLGICLAGLAASLGLYLMGYPLILGWDAYLLLCGLGLGLMALGKAAKLLAGLAKAGAKPAGGQGSGAAAAVLPGLVLFFFLPANIYTHNQGDLDYNLALLVPFGAALAAYLLLLAAVSLYKAGRPAIYKTLFFIGLFLLIRDMAAPLEVGELAGSLAIRDVSEPVGYMIIDGLLALGTLAAIFLVPWGPIKRFAGLVVIILALAHAAIFGFSLDGRSHLTFAGQEPEHPTSPPARPAQAGNVYHLILDGFSSQVLEAILRDPGLARSLEGFTFFRRARSNYLFTGLSIPSFMTGTLAPYQKQGQSLDQWKLTVKRWTRKATTRGILESAYQAGYTVTQYMNTRLFFPHQRASTIYYGAQLFGELAVRQAMVRFADLWLLRAAPTILKQETWTEENRGRLAGLLAEPGDHAWAYWGVRQLAKMTQAEAARPARGQYVYGHFLMPHRPLVLDADCRYRPGGKTAEGYLAQATCVVKKVAEFLNELKRLGRFDDALILVHADHASRLAPVADQRESMPAWLIEEIDKIKPGKVAGTTHQNLNLPLVLIKPPGAARGPLLRTDKVGQLLDLAATIYQAKQWAARAPQGRDLFQPGSDPRVDVFIHFPLKRIYQTKREYWHLIYDGAKWRLDENYPRPPRP